jgi:hypothetical protein
VHMDNSIAMLCVQNIAFVDELCLVGAIYMHLYSEQDALSSQPNSGGVLRSEA